MEKNDIHSRLLVRSQIFMLFVKSQLCPTLCNLMDYSLPGSSVHGIFQARILEWVAISFPKHLPDTGIKLMSLITPAPAGGFCTTAPPGAWKYRNAPEGVLRGRGGGGGGQGRLRRAEESGRLPGRGGL